MKTLLNGNDWTLEGFMQHKFDYGHIMETGAIASCEIGPYPAKVPGSVHGDMLKAGLIPDWNYGLNFFASEWLEHRQWAYRKTFTVQDGFDRYVLHCDGLDYSGKVIVNEKTVMTFCGTHLRYEADITDVILPNEKNCICIVFDPAPHTAGQIGYTSREKTLKCRFNYGWDWCPRLVNTGIWRDIYIECTSIARITDFFPDYSSTNGIFTARFETTVDALQGGEYETVSRITDQSRKTAAEYKQKCRFRCTENTDVSVFDIGTPKLWYPNGYGEQNLYTATVELLKNGVVIDSRSKTVGFRSLSYEKPDTPIENTLPYVPVINGKKIFIKGINWVPYYPFYGECTEEGYRKQLTLFRKMNVTLIRVWGGAVLENDAFYRICDEYGIMVFQEFPQSSSAIDNTTCEEQEYIDRLTEVAKTDILLRRHHVSLTYWCGGNELYTHSMIPIDCAHSFNLEALRACCAQYDKSRLFVPASPYGTFANTVESVETKNADIHGPWDYLDPAEHYRYWNRNIAVLNSEIGVPAPPRYSCLEKYRGQCEIFPDNRTNPYWQNRGSWWIRDDRMKELFGEFHLPEDAAKYFALWRWLQAEGIRYAVESRYIRSEQYAGIIIWMANEPFPNNANTSLIEYDATPKPAYYSVKNAYAESGIFAKYDDISIDGGAQWCADVFVRGIPRNEQETVTAEIFDQSGAPVFRKQETVSVHDCCQKAFRISFKTEAPDKVYLVRLGTERSALRSELIFCTKGETAFSALSKLPVTQIEVTKTDTNKCTVRNTGKQIAFGVFACGEDSDGAGSDCEDGYFNLLPAEEKQLYFSADFERVYHEFLNPLR